MADKHWETQPRVPAENENGGEWTSNNDTSEITRETESQTQQKTSNEAHRIPQEVIEYCDNNSYIVILNRGKSIVSS